MLGQAAHRGEKKKRAVEDAVVRSIQLLIGSQCSSGCVGCVHMGTLRCGAKQAVPAELGFVRVIWSCQETVEVQHHSVVFCLFQTPFSSCTVLWLLSEQHLKAFHRLHTALYIPHETKREREAIPTSSMKGNFPSPGPLM